MPLNLPEPELRAYADGRAPAAHLDFLYAAGFRAAGAALRLGVFDALGDGPLQAKELASRLGCDEHAMGILLRALTAFSYVEESDGCYVNRIPDSYAIVFSFWQEVLFDLWDRLEESVRTGQPAVDFYGWLQTRPDTLQRFQTMLSRLCGMLTPEILDLVPVPAATGRLLDIGGGHAGYSMAFCHRYPQMEATVLDLESALATGAQRIAEAGLSRRITSVPWDFFGSEPIPGAPYDLVLLFNIVHGLRPERILALLQQAAAATAPGGTVALLEPLDDPGPSGSVSGDAFVKLFSLNLFHGQGGQAYPLAELTRWLTETGFTDVRRHHLKASSSDHLILARKPVP